MPRWNAAGDLFRRLWAALFPPEIPDRRADYRWNDHLARCERYAVLSAFYSQTAYNGRFAQAIRAEFGAYRFIRPIYNACGRIVEFHAAHIQGGQLDPEAGDGQAVPSALPIILDKRADKAIPQAIRRVWQASGWQSKKTLYARWGAMLGDVGLEVIADEEKGKMRLRVVHPSEFVWVTKDPYGNVKAYELRRWETDPEDRKGERIAEYREIVENDGGTVTYRTLRDGSAYAWPGTEGAEWETGYGFVPMTLTQHIDHGGDWGTAEIQMALHKTVERDGMGANLSDQAMKAVNGPWFLTGAALPAPATPTANSNPWDGDPFCSPGSNGTGNGYGHPHFAAPNLQVRMDETTSVPIITCNAPDARMTPLIFPVPIADVDAHIDTIAMALALDYPELLVDSGQVSGDASAKALREVKAKTRSKIEERRVGYDAAHVRALQMAMTIGGVHGFDGFTFVNPGSFEAGKLDFHIGQRPVFAPDEQDRLDVETARAGAVSTYVSAGMPLAAALLRTGVEQEEVDQIIEDQQADAEWAMERVKLAMREQGLGQQQDQQGQGQGQGQDQQGQNQPVGAGVNGNGNGFKPGAIP